MKRLKTILQKKSGRGFKGRVTTRHQGGGQKRFLRKIDFKRTTKDIWGVVTAIEYDPNRSCAIALITYKDGQVAYWWDDPKMGVRNNQLINQLEKIK